MLLSTSISTRQSMIAISLALIHLRAFAHAADMIEYLARLRVGKTSSIAALAVQSSHQAFQDVPRRQVAHAAAAAERQRAEAGGVVRAGLAAVLDCEALRDDVVLQWGV